MADLWFDYLPALDHPFLDYPELGDFYYPPAKKGYFGKSIDYLENSRDSIGNAVARFGKGMDDYFAGEKFDHFDNQSYLSVRLTERWAEAGKLEPEFKASFRLDMPGTEERYRVILEYDDDSDDESLQERSRPSEAVLAGEDRSLLAGLVKNLANEGDKWQRKLSGGVRVRLRPLLFVRYKAEREIDVGDVWNLNLYGKAQWRSTEGIHNEFDIVFDRLVWGGRLLQYKTLFDWRSEKRTTEMGQQLSLSRKLSQTKLIQYQLGIFSSGFKDTEVDIYYASIQYRSQAYEDWLFLKVIPELAFREENDFSGEASITVAVEILFRGD